MNFVAELQKRFCNEQKRFFHGRLKEARVYTSFRSINSIIGIIFLTARDEYENVADCRTPRSSCQ
jgi:hypothetical protein